MPPSLSCCGDPQKNSSETGSRRRENPGCVICEECVVEAALWLGDEVLKPAASRLTESFLSTFKVENKAKVPVQVTSLFLLGMAKVARARCAQALNQCTTGRAILTSSTLSDIAPRPL